jgi:integrase/recombinase XerD
MDSYLEWLAVKGQSPRTIETRRRWLVLFIHWCQKGGLMLPAQITRPILQGYQLHLWEHRTRSGKHLAAGMQIGRPTAVRGLFRWLCRQGLLDHDPSALLDLPREERCLPANTLSEAEVIAILRVPNVHDPLGVRNRAMLEVL